VPSESDAVAKPRSKRRASKGRQHVLEATAKVIVERGADATRFSDVSAASNVPVSSLQYYFGSRDDLLIASFRHASESELAALREELRDIADPWARLIRIVDVAISGFDPGSTNAGLLWMESWRFALRDPELRADVMADYAAWRALISESTEAGIKAGRFSSDVSPEVVAVQTIAMVDGISMPAALGDPDVSIASGREAVLQALRAILRYDD